MKVIKLSLTAQVPDVSDPWLIEDMVRDALAVDDRISITEFSAYQYLPRPAAPTTHKRKRAEIDGEVSK